MDDAKYVITEKGKIVEWVSQEDLPGAIIMAIDRGNRYPELRVEIRAMEPEDFEILESWSAREQQMNEEEAE